MSLWPFTLRSDHICFNHQNKPCLDLSYKESPNKLWPTNLLKYCLCQMHIWFQHMYQQNLTQFRSSQKLSYKGKLKYLTRDLFSPRLAMFKGLPWQTMILPELQMLRSMYHSAHHFLAMHLDLASTAWKIQLESPSVNPDHVQCKEESLV